MPPLAEDEVEELTEQSDGEAGDETGDDTDINHNTEQEVEGSIGEIMLTSGISGGESDAELEGEQAAPTVEASEAASGSDEEGKGDESGAETVGAVKIRPAGVSSESEAESEAASSPPGDPSAETDSGSETEAAAVGTELSAADNDSDTSGEEEGFQASSGTDEEIEAAVDRNSCIFCKQCEDDDPSDDPEPYLTCSVCGDHSHRQCARNNNSINEEEEIEKWRCPACIDNNLESLSPESKISISRSSAPRLVRDLLPVSRGVQKPDSHSIFAQPLISEGRLRKRKSPTGEPLPQAEKRRRKATPRAQSTAASNAPVEEVRSDLDKMEVETPLATRLTRRASHKAMPLVRIIQQRPFHKDPPHKFILAFHLDQSEIANILSQPPKPRKTPKRDRRRAPKIPPPPVYEPPIPKFPALPTSHLIFPLILTERENELNSKPYGGILSESDADTSRSLPAIKDREIFEAARKEAEEERRKTSAAAEGETHGDGTTTTARTNRTVSGPPTKIKCIQFGKFVIDTFYASPYPEEYSHESRLFICEFCLKYLPSEFVAYRHKLKCPAKHPPGDEIYRDGSLSIWEVDGRKKTEYCQCLCLMAKMFLGSKTLYYDVEPFLFYILTEYDELGYHFVGYFSKEKRPTSLNNVSCILVMPIHQRKGYATFLIDFSYLLTRIEGKEGSPEKPLSDMGLTAYRSYWDLTISRHLLNLDLKPFSTRTLMERTGMTADDVIHSLERLYAFIRDPVTKTYAIRFDRKLYTSIVENNESKEYRQMRPEMLIWTPYVTGRSDHAMLEDAPMQTMAPRDGDDNEDDHEGVTQTLQSGLMAAEMTDGVDTGSAGYGDEGDSAPKSRSPKKSKSRSKSKSSNADGNNNSPATDARDEMLVDDSAPIASHAHTAPGPPPTSTLDTAITNNLIQHESNLNGITNGIHTQSMEDVSKDYSADADEETPLTGYALAFRTHEIPPTRFQIDPAIPPSMLRSRSTKKRNYAGAFGRRQSGANGNGASSAVAKMPVRSSPRNASSNNGNGSTTPDNPGTPMRRSARGSKLATEVVSMDGAADEDGLSEDEDEEPELAAKKEGSSGSEVGEEEIAEDDDDEEGGEEEDDDDDEGEEDDEVAVADDDDDDEEEDGEEEEDDDDDE